MRFTHGDIAVVLGLDESGSPRPSVGELEVGVERLVPVIIAVFSFGGALAGVRHQAVDLGVAKAAELLVGDVGIFRRRAEQLLPGRHMDSVEEHAIGGDVPVIIQGCGGRR